MESFLVIIIVVIAAIYCLSGIRKVITGQKQCGCSSDGGGCCSSSGCGGISGLNTGGCSCGEHPDSDKHQSS